MRVTAQQARALALLREDPSASLHELIEEAQLPMTNPRVAQAFLWRLIDSGLIQISLTPAGEAAASTDPEPERRRA